MKAFRYLAVPLGAAALLAACAAPQAAGPAGSGAKAKLPAVGTSERSALRFGVLYNPSECDCGSFQTFTQGGWGAKPRGGNPGSILHDNFAGIAPLIVGVGYSLRFDSAQEVTDFLPSGTTAGVLTQSYDPPTGVTSGGVFSAQLTALKLNVLLDDEIRPNASGELADVEIVGGPYAGMSIGEFLALAEQVLGGNTGLLGTGQTVDNMKTQADAINNGFHDEAGVEPDGTTYRCGTGISQM